MVAIAVMMSSSSVSKNSLDVASVVVVLLSPGFFAHFSRKKKSIKGVCVSLSEFQKCPSHFTPYIISHAEREKEKKRFDTKLSSASTKVVVVVVPTKSQSRFRRFRRRRRQSVRCLRREEIVSALSIKVVRFFWSSVFFLLFCVSLSIIGSFFFIFCLNPKPRRILEKEEEEGDDEDEE